MIETGNLKTAAWDLTRLYGSLADPEIEADMKTAARMAEEFRTKYHGAVADGEFPAGRLEQAIRELEDLQETALKPYLYAQLLFSADTEPEDHKGLVQKAREFVSRIRQNNLFFELEILEIKEERYAALLSDPTLARVRHYLKRLRLFKPYTLSEKEEQIVSIKDMAGKHAFGQLFEELSASFRYRLSLDGAEREYTGEELLAMLHRPEAEVRERAFSMFLDRHGENALVLSSVFNNIILDHAEECALRGYADPMTATHLVNELSSEAIERMMQITEENYSLAQHYFRLKASLLGMPKLKNSDVYAPVGHAGARVIPFDEAREKVLMAYGDFSPEMEGISRAFFEESRIDSAVRHGKTGGAFCNGMTPKLPPYILMNYTGNLRDVATLAHELGHGVHFTLSKRQRLVNYDAVLPMAETASVFGEILLTRLLLEEEDPKVRISILCARIEDIIATTFRQNVLTRFEIQAHRLRKERLLSPGDLCDLWWEENRRLYGDAVEMIPSYKWGWSYISHFIHTRFYCYSYIFGELLVLSLFQRYREQGSPFVKGYLELLSAGGSESPPDLLSGNLGIEVNDPGFWQKGYDLLAELISELDKIT